MVITDTTWSAMRPTNSRNSCETGDNTRANATAKTASCQGQRIPDTFRDRRHFTVVRSTVGLLTLLP